MKRWRRWFNSLSCRVIDFVFKNKFLKIRIELEFWSFLLRDNLIDLLLLDFEFIWLFGGGFLFFFEILLLEWILLVLVLIRVNFFMMFNNCINCGGIELIFGFFLGRLDFDFESFKVNCKKRL